MKKLITLFISVCLSASLFVPSDASELQEEQQQQRPQQTQKKIIQTPFGPKEVEEPVPQQPEKPPQPVAAPQTPAPAAPPEAAAAPGPAQAQPPAQREQTPVPQQAAAEQAPISLHLDNADIYQVIRIIGDALQLNYVIDPTVRGTVNINTSGTLRQSDLLPILETILKINGATMVKTGNFYQIVPANTAVRQPLEVQEAVREVVPDDQIVMQIIRMKFVAASEMARLLNSYLSEGGNIVVHDAGNILLVSERRSNLRKLLEIVDIFDTNFFEGERVRMIPVKNNLARDLIDDLRMIFSGYALSERSTAIRFVAIERMNSILVVTPNPAVFAEVEKWLARLDQPLPTAGIRNFVYKVKNAKAADIQKVLAQLYGSRVQPSSVTQPPVGATTVPGAPPQATPPPSPIAPGAAPAVVGGVLMGDVKVIADEINNALVVQATPQEYAEIERTIQQLDILPRQVLIDAQIYEVVLDHSLALGVSATLQNRGTLVRPQTTASFASAGTGPPSLIAQSFAFVGRTRELVAFLNASENRSRVRTLSAPSVLVSDNMTADFQVGAEVPIPTTSSITPVQQAGTNLFAQTIQFRTTGVILRVKPQINESGRITLEIAQEVSQAGSNTTSAIVAPVIGKSAVSSTVVVADGQTIALGGFIRENRELSTARVPFLGSIPIVGLLFGNTRQSTNRTELIILITPHVIRTHDEADLATDELKAKLKEVKKLLK